VETATITVDDGAHGNGAGLALTVTAAAPTRLAADVNGGSTPTAGLAFAVDLRVLDAYGNASAVAAPTSVTLSRAAGTGTLGGSLSGTIAAGQSQVTVSGLTYTKAENGVKLTAARTSGDALLAGTSAGFNVDPGAAASFVVTGSGTQTAGNPNQLTIAAYDANGNLATGYAGAH